MKLKYNRLETENPVTDDMTLVLKQLVIQGENGTVNLDGTPIPDAFTIPSILTYEHEGVGAENLLTGYFTNWTNLYGFLNSNRKYIKEVIITEIPTAATEFTMTGTVDFTGVKLRVKNLIANQYFIWGAMCVGAPEEIIFSHGYADIYLDSVVAGGPCFSTTTKLMHLKITGAGLGSVDSWDGGYDLATIWFLVNGNDLFITSEVPIANVLFNNFSTRVQSDQTVIALLESDDVNSSPKVYVDATFTANVELHLLAMDKLPSAVTYDLTAPAALGPGTLNFTTNNYAARSARTAKVPISTRGIGTFPMADSSIDFIYNDTYVQNIWRASAYVLTYRGRFEEKERFRFTLRASVSAPATNNDRIVLKINGAIPLFTLWSGSGGNIVDSFKTMKIPLAAASMLVLLDCFLELQFGDVITFETESGTSITFEESPILLVEKL